MLIRNDINYMPIEQEINHIIKALNSIIRKIKCKKIIFYNNNTLEDIAFLKLFQANEKRINADLWYAGDYNDAIIGENIFYFANDFDFILKVVNSILTTNEFAIINTDTLFSEKAIEKKINGNIEIFKDYSREFLNKILDYYKYEDEIKALNINMSDRSQEILNDYLLKNDLPSKYTREELKSFSMELPPRAVTKGTIYNSITTNYIKGVNKDLEKLTD